MGGVPCYYYSISLRRYYIRIQNGTALDGEKCLDGTVSVCAIGALGAIARFYKVEANFQTSYKESLVSPCSDLRTLLLRYISLRNPFSYGPHFPLIWGSSMYCLGSLMNSRHALSQMVSVM